MSRSRIRQNLADLHQAGQYPNSGEFSYQMAEVLRFFNRKQIPGFTRG